MTSHLTNTFDLIIVGGGIAGLTAGVRATELGLKPVVLEQGEGVDYPNNSRQSGGILHIGFYDPFRPAPELEKIIHQLTNGEAKPELTKALANNGARLITWLQDKGGKFMRFNPKEGYRWCMAPPRALKAGLDWKGRGPDLMIRRLAEELIARGGVLQQGARVTGLLMENGRCVGAQGTLQDNPQIWNAPYCVIADGGFQANRELYERYIGADFESVFQRGARTGRGDGLKMALSAGGSVTSGKRFYGHVLCSDALHNDNVWPYPEVDAIATAGIVIDSSGQRIVDEGRSGVHLANQLASSSNTGKLFAVFDQTIWDGPGTSARIPANPLLEKAGGTILRANTEEELAEKMGVPFTALINTINEYNVALSNNQLDTLSVPRSNKVKPMSIMNAPFMAIPICPGITYTMVGIDIDEHAQVLDTEKKPILGLFAAGATTGGIEGGQDSVYIGGLIKSGSFGLIAAERIATLEGKSVSITSNQNSQRPEPHLSSAGNVDILAQKSLGLERFPILRGTILYGKPIAIILGFLCALICYALLLNPLGLWSVFIAIGVGLFIMVTLLGVVELVKLVTEFLIPHQDS